MSDLISRQEALYAVGLNTWAGSRISTLPTIDAIPIEWVKAYLDSYRAKFEEMDRFIMEEYAGYEDNFYRTKVHYIEEMLKDWEKENGAEQDRDVV